MEAIDEPLLEYEYRKRTAAEMDTEYVIREQIELRLMPDNSWEQTLGRPIKYYNIDYYSSLKIDRIVIKRMTEDDPVIGYSYGRYMLKQIGIMNGAYYIIQFVGNFQINDRVETISVLLYEDGTYFYDEDSTIKNIEVLTLDLKLIN